MRRIVAMLYSIVVCLLVVSVIACSSEDRGSGSADATHAQELKAKIVYFSIPG